MGEEHKQAQAVRKTFQSYLARMNDLDKLLSEGLSLSRQGTAKARQLYTDLKHDLKAEIHKHDTVRGNAAMNTIEQAFLDPALRDACLELSAGTNSNPYNANWGRKIDSAKSYLRSMLASLDSKYPSSE